MYKQKVFALKAGMETVRHAFAICFQVLRVLPHSPRPQKRKKSTDCERHGIYWNYFAEPESKILMYNSRAVFVLE